MLLIKSIYFSLQIYSKISGDAKKLLSLSAEELNLQEVYLCFILFLITKHYGYGFILRLFTLVSLGAAYYHIVSIYKYFLCLILIECFNAK